jgi:hypothetical protein
MSDWVDLTEVEKRLEEMAMAHSEATESGGNALSTLTSISRGMEFATESRPDFAPAREHGGALLVTLRRNPVFREIWRTRLMKYKLLLFRLGCRMTTFPFGKRDGS